MKLATISNLKKYYGDRLILDIDKFEIEEKDKIGVVGENGCGKTTLLNRIMDSLQGEELHGIKVSKGVKIWYFQQKNMFDEDKSVLENMRMDSSLDESFIRTNLGEFGFKENYVYKLVGCLSGGERVKAAICKIILADNNFLVLDEPTNYLDIKTIAALENALINTNKTILLDLMI